MQPVDLRIDVSAAVPLEGPLMIAASVYLPEAAAIRSPPLVMFASPGGGYSRGYYDLHFPGHTGYSQAEYHVRRGAVFVAYDHLGVGDSTTHQNAHLTTEMMAEGNHAMVREILGRLSRGVLQAGFPPLAQPFVVGIGQSMGAGITIIMQGRHRTFDAVGILGVSAIHTQLPMRTPEAAARARNAFRYARTAPPEQMARSVVESAAQISDFVYPFHWDEEPPEIIDADLKGGYPVRRTAPYFGSKTVPNCAPAMMSPGFFTPEAALIEVPVLIGVGERDVCPNPWAEPAAYSRSADIALLVVPRMAHMHNFAPTRELLWQRIADWSVMLSRSAETQAVSPAISAAL